MANLKFKKKKKRQERQAKKRRGRKRRRRKSRETSECLYLRSNGTSFFFIWYINLSEAMYSKGKFPSSSAGFGVICQVNHDIFSCFEQRQLEYVPLHPRIGMQVNNSQQTTAQSAESENLQVLSLVLTTFFHDLAGGETVKWENEDWNLIQSFGTSTVLVLEETKIPIRRQRGVWYKIVTQEDGKTSNSGLINIWHKL